jgi:FlaA1/EpsC-like NDP-sugar epimerase
MTEDPIGQTAPSMPRWQGTGHALEAPWVGGLERAIAAATLLGACLVWGRQPDVPVLALMTWAAAFGAGPGRSLASAREPWIGHILTSWTLKIALLATIGWVAQMMAFFDQRVLASWVIAAPLAQIASRASWQHLVGRIRQAQPLPSAVVVGANPLGRALARSLPNQDLQPCRLLGFFDDRARSRLGGVSEAGVLGAVGDVVEFARHHHLHRTSDGLASAHSGAPEGSG